MTLKGCDKTAMSTILTHLHLSIDDTQFSEEEQVWGTSEQGPECHVHYLDNERCDESITVREVVTRKMRCHYC